MVKTHFENQTRTIRNRADYLGILLLTTCLVASTARAGEDFAVVILRQHAGSDCTSGYLQVNGTTICYVLEKASLGNLPVISAIPAGKFSAHLRYDHADAWRIELENVPNRSNIQIHIGNVSADSSGCILVGDGLQASDLCKLTGSAAAYKKLKAAFYGTSNPVATPDKTISVTLKDPG